MKMRTKRYINQMMTSLLSIVIAVIIGSIVIGLCGYSPISAYTALLKGAFGSPSLFMTTMEKSVPLIFCGIAAMISFKCGLFNIGIEGQLIMGAITYALIGIKLWWLPMPIHVFVCSILAMAAGALWSSIAAILKVTKNANEVVTTVMLNYVAIYFTEFLVAGPFMAEGMVAQSEALDENKMIPLMPGSTKLTWACVIALIFLVVIALFYKYTVTGYNMIATGVSFKAAEAGGIRMNSTCILSMALSGAIAGLGGAMLVSATYGRFVLDMSSGYGFDGMAIAVLGQNSAIGVFFSSILFGGLRTGSLYMAMFEGIPSELVSILQGVIILIISAPLLVHYLRVWRKKNE